MTIPAKLFLFLLPILLLGFKRPKILPLSLKQTETKEEVLQLKIDSADNLIRTGNTYFLEGNIPMSFELWDKSLALCKRINYLRGIVKVLLSKSECYTKQYNFSTAKKFNQLGLSLAKKIGDKSLVSWSLDNAGTILYETGDIEGALGVLDKGLKIIGEHNNVPETALILNSLGTIHRQKGNSLEAISYFRRSLNISKKIKNKGAALQSIVNIASVYKDLGDIQTALVLYQKGLKMNKKYGNVYLESRIFNNLAVISTQLNDFETSIMYHNKSLKINSKIGIVDALVSSLNNIGLLYNKQGDLNQAFYYHNRALSIARKSNNRNLLGIALNALAWDHYKKDELLKAFTHWNKGLKLFKSVKSEMGIISCFNGLSRYYLKKLELNDAIKYAKLCLKKAKEIRSNSAIRYSTQVLIKIYEKKNDYKNAYKMSILYFEAQRSINNSKTQQELARITNLHDLEKRDQQIKLLNNEKKLQKAHLHLFMMTTSIIIILIIVFVTILLQRKKKRYETELNKLRKLKLEPQLKSKELITSIPIVLGKKIFSIKVEDISYFKGDGRYVLLTSKNGRSYITDFTLALLEKSLPKSFIRIHRSYIINQHKIIEMKKVNRGRVSFSMVGLSDTKIISSIRYSKVIRHVAENFYPAEI